jgi:hypothetical protein
VLGVLAAHASASPLTGWKVSRMNRRKFPIFEVLGARPFASAVALVTMFPILWTTGAYAHGIVGNRVFLSPIVGNDAFPDNALDLTMRRSNYQFSLLPAFEKQLSDNSSLLFAGVWYRVTPGARQHRVEDFGDLTIYYRHSLYISVPHELELTFSPFLVVSTGTRRIADQGYTHLGGEMLLGKGLGDLPDSPSLKYLRPFAVQAEAGYAGRIQGPANSDVFANLELEYSVQYLDKFVKRLDIGRPLVELVPFVQLNYAQSFIASRITTKPDFRLTPVSPTWATTAS